MVKRDRTARLVKLEHLLYQHPEGLGAPEIGRRLGISRRTVYRDIEALDYEVGIPVWQNKGKYGVREEHYLPPIRLSPDEAVRVFLAARLMLRYANRRDPKLASLFLKLNSILPSPLRPHVERTFDWMSTLAAGEQQLHILDTLAEAWMNCRTVKILYQTPGKQSPTERMIDPYFIEPAAAGHSSYIIAYCHLRGYQRTFKIDRIKEIEATGESYEIPVEFDANALLASSWGIMTGTQAETVKLKFKPEIAMLPQEVIWHPSQVVQSLIDGSVMMTMQVGTDHELRSWILSWGNQVEVIEPESLRMEVAETTRTMFALYQ
jgi:predicted DNA-binding transcriptional regulator YafY